MVTLLHICIIYLLQTITLNLFLNLKLFDLFKCWQANTLTLVPL